MEVKRIWWKKQAHRYKIQICTFISFSTCWQQLSTCATQKVSPRYPVTPPMYDASDAGPVFQGRVWAQWRKKVQWICVVPVVNQPLLSGKQGQDKQFTCDSHIQIGIPQNQAPTHSPSACPGQASGIRSLALHPQSPGSLALSFWLLCSHSRSWECTVNLAPRLQLRMYLEGMWWMRQLNNMSWPGTTSHK